MSITTLNSNPYIKPSTIKPMFISTGIPQLDEAINGLQPGTVVTITGRPGEGKSTFVHGIVLDAIDKRMKVLLADGEHDRNHLYNILFQKAIGHDESLYKKVPWNYRVVYEPKPMVLEKLNEWFGDYLLIDFKYERKSLGNFEELYNEYYCACKSNDIKLIVLDNLMSLVDSTQAEMNAKQGQFVKMCCNLAKAANVVIVLVAHPNGTAQKGYELDYYQISGTANIPDLSHCVLQVIKEPVEHVELGQPDGRIKVMKSRTSTTKERIDLIYDKKTGRLTDTSEVVNTYNWRMDGKQYELDRAGFKRQL